MKAKRKTHKKRKPTLSAKPRRRRRAHKSFLSDLTNPTMAKNSAKATITSAIGGFGAVIVNKVVLPEKWGKTGKVATGLIGGFLMQNFGMPTVGASFTGGMFALAFQAGLLNEDANFADENSLSNAPLYLDEEGTPLVLTEDSGGNEFFREMSDEEATQMGY